MRFFHRQYRHVCCHDRGSCAIQDIRLSGNRVRVLRARRPVAGPPARLHGRCEAGLGARKRDAAKRQGPARRARQAAPGPPDHALVPKALPAGQDRHGGRRRLPVAVHPAVHPADLRRRRGPAAGPGPGRPLTPAPGSSRSGVAFHVLRRVAIRLAILPFCRGLVALAAHRPLARCPCPAAPWRGPCSGRCRRFRRCSGLAASAADRRHRRHPGRAGLLGWRLAKDVQDVRMYGRPATCRSSPAGSAGRSGRTRARTRPAPPNAGAPGRTGSAAHAGHAADGPTGPRPPRCPTPSTPAATTRPPRRGRGRRSRSRTPWPNWTP